MSEFKDRAVLITGAGRGVGKRLALGFAGAGAKVGLLARSKTELDLTHLEIEHQGGVSMKLRADVREADALRTAADRMREKFGPVHTVICAAAVQGPIGPFLEGSSKAWIETIETNLIGVMNTCAALLQEMVKRRAGKILVLSGGGGAQSRPGFAPYAASKTAVIRFVETLADELREHNVQANCMSPGGAYTHMTDEILSAGMKAGWKELENAQSIRLTGGIPAEKQIALAMFLTSERSNHVSGKMVHVNDDWRKLENSAVPADLYTLRRVQKV
ncbi:MAG: SDR family oxidoreductase [Acidobacteria bacterium]|nr:SDR family oxidoreductase [Acidobacteriota bacterium]